MDSDKSLKRVSHLAFNLMLQLKLFGKIIPLKGILKVLKGTIRC